MTYVKDAEEGQAPFRLFSLEGRIIFVTKWKIRSSDETVLRCES